MNQHQADSTRSFASAARGLRHVFVNRLAVEASIGIHPHERAAKQTVWVSIDAAVADDAADMPAEIGDVVCYEGMTRTVTELLGQGHIDLVETLAEMIADALLQDRRIRRLTVRLEKPQAIEAAESVGIAIERLQTA